MKESRADRLLRIEYRLLGPGFRLGISFIWMRKRKAAKSFNQLKIDALSKYVHSVAVQDIHDKVSPFGREKSSETADCADPRLLRPQRNKSVDHVGSKPVGPAMQGAPGMKILVRNDAGPIERGKPRCHLEGLRQDIHAPTSSLAI